MNLRGLLKEKDLSAAWLARQLGVSRQSVSNWCRGDEEPRLKHVRKIAEVFHMTIEEVLNYI